MEDIIFEHSTVAKQLANYKLPRYNELIKFDVFMNQLLGILDEYLEIFSIPGEQKTLTASMVNNYVFKNIIERPIQKKYSRSHIAYLLVIGILKQVLPISDVAEIISMALKQYDIEVAYEYFCIELEKALKATFEVRDFAVIEETQPSKTTPLSTLVRSAVLSFANQLYVRKSIYYATHNVAAQNPSTAGV